MIGHFAKDQLIVDGHAETASGGGVYYGSVALRHLGLRVAVVTRLHPDDFPRLDEMRQGGAPGDVDVFATPAPATSGIANYYNSQNMERRICKPLGFAGPFTRADIAAALESLGPPRAIIIASIIAGEVDLPLLKWLATEAINPPSTGGQRSEILPNGGVSGGGIGLDVQGFIRVREDDRLVFRPWETMAEALAHVTYLKADRAEAESLTGETSLHKAARALAAYGPREIVLTQSSGVTVYDAAHDAFHTAPFTSRSLAGRTGRGDTCFATYIGKRLTLPPAEATRWAAAVTTLKQEKPGPWRGEEDAVKALLEKRP
jgi:sugar/nucleoside kinase (ribokinase family)